jgi:hypothetical protein
MPSSSDVHDRTAHTPRSRASGCPRTAYVHWIRRYILLHHKQHPTALGAPDVTAFLTSLAVERSVAASTQNQAFAANGILHGHSPNPSAPPGRARIARLKEFGPRTWPE